MHLYRIAQEAVRNALKHGKARQIAIGLKTGEKKIVLSVRDNGAGIPLKLSKSKGLGLRIMDHRARLLGGSLLVRKSQQGGTAVLCSIPEPARQYHLLDTIYMTAKKRPSNHKTRSKVLWWTTIP